MPSSSSVSVPASLALTALFCEPELDDEAIEELDPAFDWSRPSTFSETERRASAPLSNGPGVAGFSEGEDLMSTEGALVEISRRASSMTSRTWVDSLPTSLTVWPEVGTGGSTSE